MSDSGESGEENYYDAEDFGSIIPKELEMFTGDGVYSSSGGIGDLEERRLMVQPYLYEPTRRHQEEKPAPVDKQAPESSLASGSDRDLEDRGLIDSSLWCSCGKCKVLPLAKECICCQEMWDTLDEKLDGVQCITFHDDFNILMLSEPVVRLALIHSCTVFRRPIPKDPITPDKLRHSAYRQFTM